jgi:hypothetical protein
MVASEGLEPSILCRNMVLNHARMPVPPRSRLVYYNDFSKLFKNFLEEGEGFEPSEDILTPHDLESCALSHTQPPFLHVSILNIFVYYMSPISHSSIHHEPISSVAPAIQSNILISQIIFYSIPCMYFCFRWYIAFIF